MPIYNQASGVLSTAGAEIGVGYSGKGTNCNMPTSEHVPSRGPVPKGRYRLEFLGNQFGKGAIVFSLVPVGTTQTFGRSGFLVHGESVGHDAPEAGIILPEKALIALRDMYAGGDNILTIV